MMATIDMDRLSERPTLSEVAAAFRHPSIDARLHAATADDVRAAALKRAVPMRDGRIQRDRIHDIYFGLCYAFGVLIEREEASYDEVDGTECQSCGGQIPGEREFCPDCGARSLLA